MTRLERTGKMETFSASVSRETKARLRKAADRAYGGNVSALIEALEADRQNALDWLLRRPRHRKRPVRGIHERDGGAETQATSASSMIAVTLDTGALIAMEKQTARE